MNIIRGELKCWLWSRWRKDHDVDQYKWFFVWYEGLSEEDLNFYESKMLEESYGLPF